ncbi:MAG: hypothetical protein LBU04_07875, partial [Christensenellaceae bacterium]|nr:hypothetical protein [Christensenellaceae bacterium]
KGKPGSPYSSSSSDSDPNSDSDSEPDVDENAKLARKQAEDVAKQNIIKYEQKLTPVRMQKLFLEPRLISAKKDGTKSTEYLNDIQRRIKALNRNEADLKSTIDEESKKLQTTLLQPSENAMPKLPDNRIFVISNNAINADVNTVLVDSTNNTNHKKYIIDLSKINEVKTIKFDGNFPDYIGFSNYEKATTIPSFDIQVNTDTSGIKHKSYFSIPSETVEQIINLKKHFEMQTFHNIEVNELDNIKKELDGLFDDKNKLRFTAATTGKPDILSVFFTYKQRYELTKKFIDANLVKAHSTRNGTVVVSSDNGAFGAVSVLAFDKGNAPIVQKSFVGADAKSKTYDEQRSVLSLFEKELKEVPGLATYRNVFVSTSAATSHVVVEMDPARGVHCGGLEQIQPYQKKEILYGSLKIFIDLLKQNVSYGVDGKQENTFYDETTGQITLIDLDNMEKCNNDISAMYRFVYGFFTFLWDFYASQILLIDDEFDGGFCNITGIKIKEQFGVINYMLNAKYEYLKKAGIEDITKETEFRKYVAEYFGNLSVQVLKNVNYDKKTFVSNLEKLIAPHFEPQKVYIKKATPQATTKHRHATANPTADHLQTVADKLIKYDKNLYWRPLNKTVSAPRSRPQKILAPVSAGVNDDSPRKGLKSDGKHGYATSYLQALTRIPGFKNSFYMQSQKGKIMPKVRSIIYANANVKVDAEDRLATEIVDAIQAEDKSWNPDPNSQHFIPEFADSFQKQLIYENANLVPVFGNFNIPTRTDIITYDENTKKPVVLKSETSNQSQIKLSTKNSASLQDSFLNFTSVAPVNYTDRATREQKSAVQVTKISGCPEILQISLDSDNPNNLNNLNNLINIPQKLDLKDYVHENVKSNTKYALYAVGQHNKTGISTIDINYDMRGKWYNFNDEKVCELNHPASEAFNENKNISMLMYIREDVAEGLFGGKEIEAIMPPKPANSIEPPTVVVETLPDGTQLPPGKHLFKYTYEAMEKVVETAVPAILRNIKAQIVDKVKIEDISTGAAELQELELNIAEALTENLAVATSVPLEVVVNAVVKIAILEAVVGVFNVIRTAYRLPDLRAAALVHKIMDNFKPLDKDLYIATEYGPETGTLLYSPLAKYAKKVAFDCVSEVKDILINLKLETADSAKKNTAHVLAPLFSLPPTVHSALTDKEAEILKKQQEVKSRILDSEVDLTITKAKKFKKNDFDDSHESIAQLSQLEEKNRNLINNESKVLQPVIMPIVTEVQPKLQDSRKLIISKILADARGCIVLSDAGMKSKEHIIDLADIGKSTIAVKTIVFIGYLPTRIDFLNCETTPIPDFVIQTNVQASGQLANLFTISSDTIKQIIDLKRRFETGKFYHIDKNEMIAIKKKLDALFNDKSNSFTSFYNDKPDILSIFFTHEQRYELTNRFQEFGIVPQEAYITKDVEHGRIILPLKPNISNPVNIVPGTPDGFGKVDIYNFPNGYAPVALKTFPNENGIFQKQQEVFNMFQNELKNVPGLAAYRNIGIRTSTSGGHEKSFVEVVSDPAPGKPLTKEFLAQLSDEKKDEIMYGLIKILSDLLKQNISYGVGANADLSSIFYDEARGQVTLTNYDNMEKCSNDVSAMYGFFASFTMILWDFSGNQCLPLLTDNFRSRLISFTGDPYHGRKMWSDVDRQISVDINDRGLVGKGIAFYRGRVANLFKNFGRYMIASVVKYD